ncbi:type VII secretion target [Microbacterium aurum]
MAQRLQVNTETIGSLAANLGTIRSTLESSASDADDLAGMIPHARLADAVQDFSSKWERRRTELADQVKALEGKATAAADAFQDVDDTQADGLESKMQGGGAS